MNKSGTRIVSNTVRFEPSNRGESEMCLLGVRVSCLWNVCLYTQRQAFLKGEKVPMEFDLNVAMKDHPDYRLLPSDIAQEVIKCLCEAWKSYFELRKAWNLDPRKQKPSLPKYRKNKKTGERPSDWIPVKSPRAYAITSTDVSIVLPKDRRSTPVGKANKRLNIKYRGRIVHQGKSGRAVINFDKLRRRWYFRWTVEVASVEATGTKCAAVDLGVRILASLSIEGNPQALHFSNREVMKDWDYWGRQIASEQSRLTKGCQPKAKEKAPTSRKLSVAHARRKDRQVHAVRCAAKSIAEICREQGVGTVYVGHPKGILRDKCYGSSKWAGRIHGFWAFARTLSILENALSKVGIAMVKVGERGSSSTCPTCGSACVVRHPRWSLSCKDCQERIHSDQAGSRNILKFQKPSVRWDGVEATPRTRSTSWNQFHWVDRVVNPGWGRVLPEFSKAA